MGEWVLYGIVVVLAMVGAVALFVVIIAAGMRINPPVPGRKGK